MNEKIERFERIAEQVEAKGRLEGAERHQLEELGISPEDVELLLSGLQTEAQRAAWRRVWRILLMN